MRLPVHTATIVGKAILVLALVSTSNFVFAAQEHKPESKPAEHTSKPNHSSNQSHTNNQNHNHPANHPSSTGHASGNRPSGAGQESRPSAERPSGNRPASPAGNRGGENPARGGNTGGNRSVAMDRGNTASHALPGRTVSLRGGGSASVRPNGQIRSINQNGMQIHNNLGGGRTVVTEHNGARIVGVGGGNGYVQRSYITSGGHSYYSRTYYSHGVYSTAVYRGYYYHGFQYYGYHPAFWFHPGFYGWGFHPWGVGISWGVGFGGWGWAGAPWFGFYGGWFAPYPVYPSPAFWLTDYLIAADLQSAYAARAEANAEANAAANDAAGSGNYSGSNSPSGYSNADNGTPAANSQTVTLSPEVKQAIAEEVKAELAEQQQQAAAQGSTDTQPQSAAPAPAPATEEVPPALDPARRAFVVHDNITVTSDGQECALTGGDVITRLTDTPDADNKVIASVSASKKTDCAAGKQITVSVDDLQEMRNHLEEQLNDGMKELAQKQGTGDMPKAPDTGMTESDIPAPQPDTTAAKQLSDQDSAATQTENQVKQEAVQNSQQ